MKRFNSVRNLFAGASLQSPPETDDELENEGANAGPANAGTGPTQAQVDAIVAAEVDKSRKAESDRWNAVMSSDAGAANPKGAARLLTMANGASSSQEVIDALGDMGPTEAAAGERQKNAQTEADRAALASDTTANPDTGGAAGKPADRRGEGSSGKSSEEVAAERKARAAKRNAGALKAGGKQANG